MAASTGSRVKLCARGEEEVNAGRGPGDGATEQRVSRHARLRRPWHLAILASGARRTKLSDERFRNWETMLAAVNVHRAPTPNPTSRK